VSFTFRRLFGILAAFTVARRVVQGFNDIVRTMVSANAAIEQSTIGIASVLSAVGEVRNAYGEAVTGVEALNIAQAEADKQVQLLRRDALSTVATFEQLAETFQVALGPGLAAGLDIDQVRVFSRQISIAASSIGLEQRQLAEEIRSILSGTINIRQTRIAAVLGITNEDIRKAKEAGELFQFLQEEFAAFDVAGARAAETFNGLVNRATDAVRLLLAEGGVAFFTEVKDLLRDVLESAQQIDKQTGEITLNPDLLRAIRTVSDALTESVALFRSFGEGVGVSGIQAVADAISTIIRFGTRLARIVVAIGRGVLDTFNLILGIARGVASIFGFVNRITGGIGEMGLDRVLRLVGQILGISLALSLITSGLIPVIRLIVASLSSAVKILRVIATVETSITALKAAQAALTVLISAKGLVILGVVLLILAATGLLSKAIQAITGFVNDLSGKLLKGIDKEVQSIINKADSGLGGFISGTLEGIKQIEEQLRSLGDEIQSLQASNRAALSAIVLGSPLGADFNATDEIATTLANFRTLTDESRLAIERTDKEANDLVQTVTRLRDEFEKTTRAEIPALSRAIGDIRSLPILSDPNTQGQIHDIRTALIDAFNLPPEELVPVIRAATDTLTQALADVGFSLNEAFNQPVGSQAKEVSDLIARLIDLRAETGKIKVIQDAILASERARQSLIDQNLSKQIAAARVDFERLNAARLQENLLARSSNNYLNLASAARLAGDEDAARLNEIKAQNAELRVQALITAQNFDNSINRLGQIKQEVDDRIRELEIINSDSPTEQEKQNLEDALALRELITDQIKLQVQAANLAADASRRQREEAAKEAGRLALQQGGNFGELFALSIDQLFTDLPSKFELLFDTLRTTISSFSQFASQALFDAFDPTKKGDILANFGQFLQQLAQQIIATLIEIAITAALLNAASSGILGAAVSGFFGSGLAQNGGGASFAEGGKIDGKTKRQARPHPAHFRRAQGRASGGRAGRPRGLHPTDTIPIWVAQNEWVIRAKAAMRLGHDAMSRINAGLFDPAEMRGVLGLGDRPVAHAVSIANKGMGMADGGRVRAAASSGSQAPLTGGSGPAIMFPSKDSVDRFLRGQKSTMNRVLAEEGYIPNG
jgi:hypothetical protein